MSRILLVALRDYRQIVSTRAFRITLLAVPLMITATIMAGPLLRPPANTAYVIVDATGQVAPAIDHRVELNYQRQLLGDLAAYARRWEVEATGPDEVWTATGGRFSDAQVEAFIAGGGLDRAMRQIRPRLPADASAFKPSPKPFLRIPPPADVPTDQGPERFAAALTPFLQGTIATADGPRPLALGVYIPGEFGEPGAVARMWTNFRPNTALIETIRAELTHAVRLRALQARGLAAGEAARIEALNAQLEITRPPGGGRERVIIRSVVPLALAYLLLMVTIITGSMMLQGIIEERSNRLLESVLACIRPGELMFGKLLGLGAIGLTITAVWVGCALGAAFFMQEVAADLVRPSLSALDQPWMIGALLFYFLAGYLIVSMVFLSIGSLSNSIQDAQAYLMPVIMAVMLPVALMMSSTLQNPDGLFPRVLSWIPIYTPFAMLARLGSGVSMLEVLGTGALLIVFVALELFLLGRVFKASLLNTGQPPKLTVFFKLMFQPPAN